MGGKVPPGLLGSPLGLADTKGEGSTAEAGAGAPTDTCRAESCTRRSLGSFQPPQHPGAAGGGVLQGRQPLRNFSNRNQNPPVLPLVGDLCRPRLATGSSAPGWPGGVKPPGPDLQQSFQEGLPGPLTLPPPPASCRELWHSAMSEQLRHPGPLMAELHLAAGPPPWARTLLPSLLLVSPTVPGGKADGQPGGLVRGSGAFVVGVRIRAHPGITKA